MAEKKLAPSFRPIQLQRYRGAPYLEKFEEKVQHHAWDLAAAAQKLLDQSETILGELYFKGYEDGFAAGLSQHEQNDA